MLLFLHIKKNEIIVAHPKFIRRHEIDKNRESDMIDVINK